MHDSGERLGKESGPASQSGEKGEKNEITRISIEKAENGFIYHAVDEDFEDNSYIYESIEDVLAAVKDDLESPHLRGPNPPLGSGERFRRLEGELAAEGVRNPAGLAAFIGRKKLGAHKFAALAEAGRKRIFK